MKPPRNRCRRVRPVLAPRTMDLLGASLDGNLYLWSAAQQVQPLDRFPMCGSRIVSGHYVLERGGKAVVAHIGNAAPPGELTVQYMCQNGYSMMLPVKIVEPMLLGVYVPDPKQDAEILALLKSATANLVARQTAPHKKRGPA